MLLSPLKLFAEGHAAISILQFAGHPFSAMLLATLLAFYTLGKHSSYSAEEVNTIASKSLEPAGIIILVTGSGGVFKQVLIDSGVGQMLGGFMAESSMPPLLLAFIVSALIRVAQGSATVAMVTGAGIMAPISSFSSLNLSVFLLSYFFVSLLHRIT